MATNSSIEWTGDTWQVTSGCTKVSQGCKNCYAEVMATRLAGMAARDIADGKDPKGKRPYLHVINNGAWNNKMELLPQNLTIPLTRRNATTYFVDSMSDLFHKDVPFDFLCKVFSVFAFSKHHTYQVLTKRPENAAKFFERLSRESGGDHLNFLLDTGRSFIPEPLRIAQLPKMGHIPSTWPLSNVWVGTSIENQAAADTRIPHLLKCPAALRFLSVEPLLSNINLPKRAMEKTVWCKECNGTAFEGGSINSCQACCGSGIKDVENPIGWVIVGGESGPGARPCNVEWIRSIVGQCKAAGVPVFVKQLGAWVDGPHDGVCVQRWLLDTNGKRSVWHPPIIRSQFNPHIFDGRPENAIAWGLGDVKGGNMEQWPADLRVREMPEVRK